MEAQQESRNGNHRWTKEDRILTYTILKRLGFTFDECNTKSEMTAMNAKHDELYEKTADIMSAIHPDENFTASQIKGQITKTNMYQQLKNGIPFPPAAWEMVECMIEAGLLDNKQFYNMHYGYFEKREEITKEDKTIKEAEEILKKRRLRAA